ncbi:RING-H2 finger protein ATL52 [Acorus calamus]|uniref:RING-type E3 ubiquitin transferase n=1 Tax=Acorus calamus TaxID=4465 RepID=A0AAV9DUM4_ACOCL|nr:RING-H2 finger protein ATL52 [Acorus calamus]
MASLDNQQTWVPYGSSPKDCSKGFCTPFCPQWCYLIFPPPPPSAASSSSAAPNVSPLVVAIIGILASALLLVTYYTVISKYCSRGGPDSPRRTRQLRRDSPDEDENDPNESARQEAWTTTSCGLDETVIKSITVCKYKRGDGFVDCTDCSVCLSEFNEDEQLRLLPKCAHAFHVACIDTWFKSHNNCPLCRANIAPLPLEPEPRVSSETAVVVSVAASVGEAEEVRQSVIEIEPIARSTSMSIADVLGGDESRVGSSGQCSGAAAMKRVGSAMQWKGRNSVLPM